MINYGQIYFRRLRFRMQIAYSSQNGILKNNWYRWTDESGFQASPLTHRMSWYTHLGVRWFGIVELGNSPPPQLALGVGDTRNYRTVEFSAGKLIGFSMWGTKNSYGTAHYCLRARLGTFGINGYRQRWYSLLSSLSFAFSRTGTSYFAVRIGWKDPHPAECWVKKWAMLWDQDGTMLFGDHQWDRPLCGGCWAGIPHLIVYLRP